MDILNRIDGNKTFIVAGLTIAYAILGAIIGQLDLNHAIELILVGLGTLGFRSALNKQ